jgi:hypothetical protein
MKAGAITDGAITDTQDVMKANNMIDRLRFVFLASEWQ